MPISITKRGYLPIITITKNDASTYVFNHFTPTYDFRVTSWRIEPVWDNVGGSFSLSISSADGTTSGANTLLANISNGNEILFALSKDGITSTNILRGVVESIEIKENSNSYMDIILSGPDWGSDILKNRIVNGVWTQKKLGSDGITPDPADTTTNITNIVTDLLTKTSSYASADSPTVQSQGIIVNASNLISTNLVPNLAEFQANMEYVDDKLHQLDEIIGAIHYVDPSKNFIMKYPDITNDALPATFLFTDDLTNAEAVAWTSGKVGLIGENSVVKKTIENHKRRLHGIGARTLSLDQSSTVTTSQTALNGNWLAMRFIPKFQRCDSIQVYVNKQGDPTGGTYQDLILELREEFNSLPIGTALRITNLPKAQVTAASGYYVFKIDVDLTIGNNYWIVLRGQTGQDASNTYYWSHDNLDTNAGGVATSADGVTWTLSSTPNRFKYAFKENSSSPIQVILPSSVSATAKHYHEEVVRRPDITVSENMQTIVSSIFNIVYREKEIVTFNIYAPDYLLTTGQKIKVNKVKSGYVINGSEYVITDLTYHGDAGDESSTGTFWYEVSLAKLNAYV